MLIYWLFKFCQLPHQHPLSGPRSNPEIHIKFNVISPSLTPVWDNSVFSVIRDHDTWRPLHIYFVEGLSVVWCLLTFKIGLWVFGKNSPEVSFQCMTPGGTWCQCLITGNGNFHHLVKVALSGPPHEVTVFLLRRDHLRLCKYLVSHTNFTFHRWILLATIIIVVLAKCYLFSSSFLHTVIEILL